MWRLLAVTALAALALALAAPARAQEGGCLGNTSANAPEPAAGGVPLLYGVYPLGFAGAVAGPQGEAKPDVPEKILAATEELRSGRAFAIHLYVEFSGDARRDADALATADGHLQRFAGAGYDVEYVVTYRPQARAGEPDVVAYSAFVRAAVARLGGRLHALQVTNEVNNGLSPNASDGAYPGARDALVRGMLAADDEARRRGLEHLQIGFNWFYRTDPQSEEAFWRELAAKGGPAWAAAVDWVGLDVYPGTYIPPGPLYSGGVLNGMSSLRCYMAMAGLAATVPIHITENGWPTGPGRSYEEQASALRQMVETVERYKANFNVTDYRWFGLRDADSSNPSFQSQYGLLRDDYSPKPAFGALRELIGRFGALPRAQPPGRESGRARPRGRLRLTLRRGVARVRGAGIRRVIFYGRRCRGVTDRAAPFRARVRCRRGLRARVVLRDGRRVTLRRR